MKYWVILSGYYPAGSAVRPHEIFPTDYVAYYLHQESKPAHPPNTPDPWLEWDEEQWQSYNSSDIFQRWQYANNWYYNEYLPLFAEPDWSSLIAAMQQAFRNLGVTPTIEQLDTINGLFDTWGYPPEYRLAAE